MSADGSLSAQEARALFPALERLTYFATNGYGLLPTTARDRMIGAATALGEYGYAAHARLKRGIDGVRAQVATLLSADPTEIGFTRNTADGLIFFAEAYRWPPGDEVLVFAGEYPTVVYPFLSLERFGVQVRIAPVEHGAVTAEQVAASLRDETRCVALSWVRFDNGARADLAAIGTVLAAADVRFVVDAIQGLGVFPIDVAAAHIDALAAGTHKWLMGLAGLGVLYVRRALLAELQPVRAALGSMRHSDDHHYPADVYPFDLRDETRRVEEGAVNEVAIAVLAESLAVIDRVGIDAIGAQVRAVTDRLCDGFVAAGGRVRSPRDGGAWSGIVALEPPSAVDVDDLWGRLLADHVAIGVRDGAVWAGAHFYTNEADADRVLSFL